MPAEWLLWVIIAVVFLIVLRGTVLLVKHLFFGHENPMRKAQKERLALDMSRSKEILEDIGRIPYTSKEEADEAKRMTQRISEALQNSRVVLRSKLRDWRAILNIQDNRRETRDAEDNIELLSKT